MANTFTVTGDGNIVFGTEEIGLTDVGEIISGGQDKGGDSLELKNRKGNTFVIIFFNDKDECELEAIFDGDYTLPERGDLIDLMDLEDVVVMSWSLKWQQDDVKKITIKATKFAAMTIS